MSFASVDDRPLPYRVRRDLSFHPRRFSNRLEFGVKDPLSLRYYQLREEEFFLLQSLDGQSSLARLQAAFSERFAPRRVSARQINAFVGMLHREGLVTTDQHGLGPGLLKPGREARRQQRREAWSNILAIRFRGIDPQPLIDWLYPKFRWLFSFWAFAGSMIFIAAAILLVVTNFSLFRSRLPEYDAFFSPQNIGWFMLAIAATKLLHELGHALTCRHYGGKCHELGVMLLVFTPCLYVNVSDAWTLASRWRRMAISAAGIYVEMIVAAACTYLWFLSEPGLLNSIFLKLMFVCSISTFFLNGNPLLRYDGYFILSDLVNVPNLHQQARTVVHDVFCRMVLGIPTANPRRLPFGRRGLLAAYAIASFAYRTTIVIAILWLLHQVLRPLGLQAIVDVLVCVVVAGMAANAVARLRRFATHPTRIRQVKWNRMTVVSLALAIAGGALLAIPLPHRIYAPAIVEPLNAQAVYVAVPGTLRDCVKPGDRVQRGDLIATLASPELQLRSEETRGRAAELEVELASLKTRVTQRSGQGQTDLDLQLPTMEKTLEDAVHQAAEQRALVEKLKITSPGNGMIFPPPARSATDHGEDLPDWTGSPLEPRNRGSYLDTGTLLCLIGDPDRMQASLIVQQADLEFVRVGQQVRLRIDQLPGRFVEGEVTEIAEMDSDQLPRELIASGRLASKATASGERAAVQAAYLVRMSILDHPATLCAGATGTACVSVAPRSLANRLADFLANTFRFSRSR